MPNQDATLYKSNHHAEFIAVADGVSSCANGRAGAEIACQAAAQLMLEETDYFFESGKNKITYLMVKYVQRKLQEEAKRTGEPLESYGATLSFACLNKRTGKVLTFMLGDSLIYAVENTDFGIVDCPDDLNDRVAATVTKHAELAARVQLLDSADIKMLMLCTDGAWKQMYSRGSMVEQISAAAINQSHEDIEEFFNRCDNFDDCSFAILKLPQ